ncbi:hypothetical protein [Alienimonas chondri]|uniref:Uncharacterized protein n=1 Tax=Alienimonas chondri TaxID=2681879 RepID=A0ABX1V6W5_9PLAN|nr:hypothetical protein [Alienimonas chondri]NNJ24028.1 hypothetical protein [Alienimonas chondri]
MSRGFGLKALPPAIRAADVAAVAVNGLRCGQDQYSLLHEEHRLIGFADSVVTIDRRKRLQALKRRLAGIGMETTGEGMFGDTAVVVVALGEHTDADGERLFERAVADVLAPIEEPPIPAGEAS